MVLVTTHDTQDLPSYKARTKDTGFGRVMLAKYQGLSAVHYSVSRVERELYLNEDFGPLASSSLDDLGKVHCFLLWPGHTEEQSQMIIASLDAYPPRGGSSLIIMVCLCSCPILSRTWSSSC